MGKDPDSFPNTLVTMFMFVTEDRTKANRVLSEVLGAFLKRPIDQLSERLLVGSPEACAEKLAAFSGSFYGLSQLSLISLPCFRKRWHRW